MRRMLRLSICSEVLLIVTSSALSGQTATAALTGVVQPQAPSFE